MARCGVLVCLGGEYIRIHVFQRVEMGVIKMLTHLRIQRGTVFSADDGVCDLQSRIVMRQNCLTYMIRMFVCHFQLVYMAYYMALAQVYWNLAFKHISSVDTLILPIIDSNEKPYMWCL